MAKLILLRHGQSKWNQLNLFTGWVDIPLSKEGIEESFAAGKKITSLPIDLIYTSSLVRAQTTVVLALSEHASGKVPCFIYEQPPHFEGWNKIYSDKAKQETIPVHIAWQLNERMYGQLQGMNKQEMKEQFGEEQVQKWRRSFDLCPPGGESLKQTAERTLPYFQHNILPQLHAGKNILIAAHGNSLRAIIMFLDHLSSDQVVHLEVPTGEPILYTFTEKNWAKDA